MIDFILLGAAKGALKYVYVANSKLWPIKYSYKCTYLFHDLILDQILFYHHSSIGLWVSFCEAIFFVFYFFSLRCNKREKQQKMKSLLSNIYNFFVSTRRFDYRLFMFDAFTCNSIIYNLRVIKLWIETKYFYKIEIIIIIIIILRIMMLLYSLAITE